MKKNLKRFVFILVFSLTILYYNDFPGIHNPSLLFGQTFGQAQDSPLKKESGTSAAAAMQDTFREIYELYKHSVVSISTEQMVNVPRNPFFNDPFFRKFFGIPDQDQGQRKQRVTGLGSGFVISNDGYICTNHHVIKGVDKVTVRLDEKTYPATVVGADELTDLALLKITSGAALKPVYLGDSDKVREGDIAIAIGNPFGLDKTFTSGVISAVGRSDVEMTGSSMSLIQTDASINPGNSGGPLINIYGEVIGINRMIYSESGGNIGIGFAVPINTAKNILEQLKIHKKVKRGYIGVQIVPFTEEYAKELGLSDNKGALLGAVIQNSPAAKGGLTEGDVITAIDDKKIDSPVDLINEVSSKEIGKTIKITAARGKQRLNFFITVAERP